MEQEKESLDEKKMLTIDQALPIVNDNLIKAGRKTIKRQGLYKHVREGKFKTAIRQGEGLPPNRQNWLIAYTELKDWLPDEVGNPNVGRYERTTKKPGKLKE